MAVIKTNEKLKVQKEAHYKEGSFVYPDQNISVDKKTEEYHKMWCEKIYNLHLNGRTWMTTATRNTIEENRRWSNGTHDTRFAVDLIFGTSNDPTPESAFDATGKDVRDINGQTPSSGRKAWANLDLSPVSVAPKIKTKINEHSRSMYYEMAVRAIDSFSIKTEESEKYKLWFYKENQKWVDSQMAAAGIGVSEPDFMPRNLDELELYAANGGIRVPYSIAMEDLIKHTFEISDWDKEVAEKVKDDLLTNGYAIIRERFDREINRVVVEYKDIAHSGMQFSSRKSFKNSEFGYDNDLIEISVIRQRLGLSWEDASALARSYAGQYGNPTQDRWENYNKQVGEGSSSYASFDAFKIPVFSTEWIDIDNEQYLRFTDQFGRRREKEYRGEVHDDETLMDNQIRYVRKCSWVVGTDYVFDWGKSEYIAKDKFGMPRLSYRGVMLATTPIIVQIKPFLKGFQLAWIKAQHAIAQAIANGFAVDVGALKEISIGKDKSWDALEVLKFYKQSSFLLYKKNNSLSGFGRSASPPVIPINNSSHENIRAQFEAMSKELSLIETTSGISGISTGEQADPNVAKFNMQISVQGTNEIINNIVRAVTDLQEDVSVNVCYRIRQYCHLNKVIADSYAEVIGETRMKAVLDAEKNHVSYGITIEAQDITEEKRNIMAMVQQFMAPNPDGSPSNIAEGIHIMDMIHQRQNLRRIGMVLGYMMEKKSEKQQAAKLEAIKAQNDQLKQLEVMKQQAAKQDQDYNMEFLNREWWSQFTVKWGKTPDQMLGLGSMPQQGAQGSPQPQEQQAQPAEMPQQMMTQQT